MMKKRGAILLIVLIVLLTISLLGASLISLFFNVLSSSQIELDRARSLYLAEAGIAQAIKGLKTQATTVTSAAGAKEGQVQAPMVLEEGSFEVYNDTQQATIVAVGNSNGVRRTIQLKYSAF